ncbi:sensor histidine kinase [Xanthobacter sp.]|uniref:sensor histidine kinase n=1 Tax=Xanthobacter sp. TaxID=35809 RepID=UPI0025ECB547|nr:sensor histidine kinase [Xanthobacter sp.]
MRPVRRSLKRAVLLNLLAPVLLLAVAIGAGGYLTITSVVESSHDRLLDGSLMAIAERLAVESGEVVVDMPQVALGMLETKTQDNVYYLVAADAGPVTGYPDLPLGRMAGAEPGQPVHWDDTYRGNAVRLAAVARHVYAVERPVIVAVAETRLARNQLRDEMLRKLGLAEAALILAIAVLAWVSVERGLTPLADLSRQIDTRAVSDWRDLRPLDLSDVPQEAMAPATAINAMFERMRSATELLRRFTADASHQMRTPLAIVRMHVDLLRRESSCPELRASTLAELDQGAERLERLITQLLTLARADESALAAAVGTPCDLGEVIEHVIAERIASIPHDTQISCLIRHRPLPLVSDTVLLSELLGNLLDNAVKYSGAGGQVVLRAERDEGVALVTIEDSGPGIPESEYEHVFQRFYRVPDRPEVPGSGLGLSIVKVIAGLLHISTALDRSPELGGLRVTLRATLSPFHGHVAARAVAPG